MRQSKEGSKEPLEDGEEKVEKKYEEDYEDDEEESDNEDFFQFHPNSRIAKEVKGFMVEQLGADFLEKGNPLKMMMNSKESELKWK